MQKKNYAKSVSDESESINSQGLIDILSGKTNTRGKLRSGSEVIVVENVTLSETLRFNENYIFTDGLYFNSGTFKKLTFDKAIFEKELIIAGGEFSDLEFIQCEFKKGISVNGGEFKGDFRIHNPKTPHVFIRNCHFYREVWLYGVGKKVEIENCHSALEVKIYPFKKFSEITLKNVHGHYTVNEMIIDCQVQIDIRHLESALIEITTNDAGQSISRLEIGAIGKNTVVQIFRVSITYFLFRNSWVLGSLYFNNIWGPSINLQNPSLHIFNSDLGNTHFNDCDFSNFTLYLENALISNCVFSGTTFPTPDKINKIEKNGDREKWRIKREAFSQLKRIYQTKGDVISAAQHQAIEFECYNKSLSWKNSFQEKTIIALNQFTNRHNQQWFRPLALLFIFTLLFYLFYCYTLFPNMTLMELLTKAELSNYYLEFLNPLHSSTFIPNQLKIKIVPGGAIFWENIHRIISSYFIYQFIQAFRKHGKAT